MSGTRSTRLLLELDKTRREINREIMTALDTVIGRRCLDVTGN